MTDKIRVAKKGDPKGEFVTVDGKRRAFKSESFISLVRGAMRAQSPNIKDRRQRLADAVDDAVNGANKDNR